MSKLSKKMARDFAENKKKSLSTYSNQQPSATQMNDPQRFKEEYVDKTVYKITKGRSPFRESTSTYHINQLQGVQTAAVEYEDPQLKQLQQLHKNQKQNY